MKLSYDLHIHSALSPCGDMDMTPNNIVNMSIIKGLDMIAITDHNSVDNVEACMKVAGDRLLVVPGIEITTAEEVHMVSYFPTLEAAKEMGKIVKNSLAKIKNDASIFGNQFVMDEDDNIVREEEILLVNACEMSIYDVFYEVKNLGGIAVPAHIDRSSYSVISNLGFMPPDIDFTSVEITEKNLKKIEKDYKNYHILTSSDAHYLENIAEPENFVDICAKTAQNLVDFLCKRE